ncbi:predicted protein [Naegleria gruberi]|uniref:Predicted protein n=1 Tax=Naegleria gruberi TaxID=5762 RepID=D2VEG4_NAEGR|nr:uncharacterized protein NAEGRDRAFT_57969 [Naegleria gruberi]EFC44795.1 predicted protein [Naegleria gruberi]|eukprot:XP_002677539.1 predicted protein [Naegleria gruberi strain NEG-M]
MPSPHNNGEAVIGANNTSATSATSSAPNDQYHNSSSNNQQTNTILPQQEVTTTTTTSLTTKQALKSSVLMTTTTAVVLNGTNNVTPTINTHTSVSSTSSTSINPASASSAMKHHQQQQLSNSSNNARPRTHSNPHAFSYRTSHHQQHYGTNSRDNFFSNLLSSISTDSNGSSRKKEFKQSITLLRNFIVRSRNAIFLVLLLLCVIASLLFVYNLRSGVFTKIQNTITTSVDDSMDSLEEATTIYDHSTYDGSLIANRHHQEPVSKSTWESLQSSDPRTDKLVMGVDEQPQEKKKKNKKKVIQSQTEEEQTPPTTTTISEQNPKLMMENNKATKTTTPIQPEGGVKTEDIKPLPYIKPLNHHDIPLPTRKPTPQEENEINTDFKIDHIYVINLKIREDRRQKSIRRLNTLGGIFSNYTFFEPVFGEALTDQDIFNHVSITTYKAILEGRSLDYQLSTKGGVGCYLTHTNIWKDMIEKGYERILIFEDDFEITSPYDEIMTYFSHLPKKFDVAFMYFSLFPGSGEFERYNDYWMTTTATRVYGAASYIINRGAAEKLLEKAFPIDLQLDAFINHYVTFTGGLRLYSSKLLFGHEITELFKTNVQDYCWKCIANNLMDNFLSVELVFNVFLIMIAVVVVLVLYVKFFSKILARKHGKQDRLAEWAHDE